MNARPSAQRFGRGSSAHRRFSRRVPRISAFYGVVITMMWRDHHPPHFHAAYGAGRASIEIDPLVIRTSTLPPRQLGMVIEWGALHQAELMANWQLARRHEPLVPVDPLH